MIPGFHGKLPASGDFVGRGLPLGFLRRWDAWASRHLVPRLFRPWPEGGLRFHLALPGLPAMTGLVLPSRDRAGRAFPLTLAAPAAGPAAAPWYRDLAEAGSAAAAGELDAAALEARLRDLPVASGSPASGLLLWTAGGAPHPAAPEAPGPVLDLLLGARKEAG